MKFHENDIYGNMRLNQCGTLIVELEMEKPS
jgi:hypothetical protein